MGVDDEVLNQEPVDLRFFPRRLEGRRCVVALELGLDRAGGGLRRLVGRRGIGGRADREPGGHGGGRAAGGGGGEDGAPRGGEERAPGRGGGFFSSTPSGGPDPPPGCA